MDSLGADCVYPSLCGHGHCLECMQALAGGYVVWCRSRFGGGGFLHFEHWEWGWSPIRIQIQIPVICFRFLGLNTSWSDPPNPIHTATSERKLPPEAGHARNFLSFCHPGCCYCGFYVIYSKNLDLTTDFSYILLWIFWIQSDNLTPQMA